MGETVDAVVAVIDIEAFSGRPDPVQRSLRRAMYDALRTAAADTHLEWSRLRAEDRGDGVLMVACGQDMPLALVGAFVHALDAVLAELAQMYSEAHRMRFRMALHQGAVTRDDDGWSGEAINIAFRLIDSVLLRDTLAAADRAHLALIVSDPFHRSVVAPGHRSVDPSCFVPITVTAKHDVRYPAWIQVLDYSAPPGLSGRLGHSAPAQATAESSHAPSIGLALNGNGDVHVAGDVVGRDKHVYGGS